MPALINPLPGAPLTDAFGYRKEVPGVPGSGGLHSGQDFKAAGGTPIRAAAAGRISFVGWKDQYGGNMVHIDHDDGTQTRYAHLSGFNVGCGQRVGAGDTIAFVGTTGASNGNHLHLEYLVNGQYVDPMPYIGADPTPKRDEDMPRILNMRQTNDGKNDTPTIFFDGGPGIGIKGIASPAHLTLLRRFIADKPGDHMYPAELATIQTYLAPNAPTLTAATIEAAVAKAINAAGGNVEAAAVAAAVEAVLQDDFAAIPKKVNEDASRRLQA